MYKQSITCLFMFSFFLANAQEKRTFLYKSQPISFLAQNNRIENDFSYPGMNAYIIIGEANCNLDSLYSRDAFRQLPITGMKDYTCFYYMPHNNLLHDSSTLTFLTEFIAYNYNKDLINRNKVHLIWLNKQDALTCDTIAALTTVIASVHALQDSKLSNCSSIIKLHSSAQETWQQNNSAKTAIAYDVPGMLDLEEKQNSEKATSNARDYATWAHNIFLQITGGSHTIGNQYRTDFDTATLVDFSKIKTIWNVNLGYHFTNWFALMGNIGFMYSGKQKKINNIDWGSSGGITVNGSGYAGLMLRYGLGCRLLPYNKGQLSAYFDCMAGNVKAIAGGGQGTRTIGGGGSTNNIVKKKATASFYVMGAGLNYRLSKGFHVTGNFQYNISSLKEPIGSVNAFTGLSVNAGIGINFPLKKKKDE